MIVCATIAAGRTAVPSNTLPSPSRPRNDPRKPEERDDHGGVHRVHALAVVARQHAGQGEQHAEGGGNERGQADRAGQDIAADSEDDEGGAERDGC